MEESEWILGHKPVERRLNIGKELKRFRHDPLDQFIRVFDQRSDFHFMQNEFTRYREAYYFYYLSLKRFLPEMSIAVRWRNGPYFVLKYGGKYTPTQRRLADQYNKISQFLEFDCFSCLLYARMLLDRTIALSRHFLKGGKLPSFTSFNEHKKFFQKLNQPYGKHEEYAEHMRANTAWFDLPVKLIRDKFLVHAGPQHMRIFGYPAIGYEYDLIVLLPSGPDPDKPLAQVKSITLSIPRLARDIEEFLTWFCRYGIKTIKTEQPKKKIFV
jgi:hypothetical protein